MVEAMNKSRSDRTAALEAWADNVNPADLREAETSSLRTIAELVDQRNEVDDGLVAAVRVARDVGRSWSEIAAMLGVSKQAAQQKYGPLSASS